MASIVFGVGTSHTPMLNSAVDEWPLFLEIDRHRPHLHKDGRRATYDDLLAVAPASMPAEIAPDKLARRHGEAMAAVSRLRDGLAAARLDAVIVVGDDQKEIYHDDLMPSVLVYRGETIANVPNRTRTPAADAAKRPAWSQRASARYYDKPAAAAQNNSELYQSVYNGWKWWHVYCYRCHGTNAVATTLAPNLLDPYEKFPLPEFMQVPAIATTGTPCVSRGTSRFSGSVETRAGTPTRWPR